MKPRRSLEVLAGLTGVSLLLLFIAPATRTIASQQFRFVLGLIPPQAFLPPGQIGVEAPPRLVEAQKDDYARVAQRYPDDIGIQMANAVAFVPFQMGEFEKDNIRHLRPLLKRYPDSPALLANLLGFGARSLDDPSGDEPPKELEHPDFGRVANPDAAESRLPSVSFSEFDRWAAAGERADPDNAFFPMMRASGFLAAGRRKDALSAIARAASKSKWEEYGHELRKGALGIPERAYGRTDPLTGTGQAYYAFGAGPSLRSVTKSAIEEAVARERAGRSEDAFRIRWNLLRTARVWREGSRTYISFMVAKAVSELAMSKLPGIEMSREKKIPIAERRAAYRNKAQAYLTRIGHAEEAWYGREAAESDARFDVLRKGFEKFDTMRVMIVAFTAWGVGSVLLNTGLWLLLLAALGAWVSRDSRAAHVWRGRLMAILVVLVVLAWQGRALMGMQASGGPVEGVSPWLLGFVTAAIGALALPLLGVAVRGIIRFVVRRRNPERARKMMSGWGLPAGLVVVLLYAAVTAVGGPWQNRFREFTVANADNECAFYERVAGVGR